MKLLVTLYLTASSLTAFSQIEVTATRKTHLLKKMNQATFNDSLVIQAGEKFSVFEHYDNGYYKVSYNHSDYYVYYPYFNEIDLLDSKAKPISLPAHNSTHKQTHSGNSSKTIRTGPRGGQYYINSNGKKTYIKRRK